MVSPFRFLKQFYLRNRISKLEYDLVKDEIYSTNRKLIMVCSFASGFLFLILFFLSLILSNNVAFLRSSIAYAVMFLAMLICFIVTYILSKEKSDYIMCVMYFFVSTLMIYCAYSGIFCTPDKFVVIAIALEFGTPMIFIDRIQRMFVFTGICSFFIGALSFYKKEYFIASVDIFNLICFWFISLITAFYVMKLKVREFGLRQIIESERDTDELTGLKNKSAFMKIAKKNLAQNKNGILIILDLDFFKHINDTYGHFVGDNVLKMVSVCIQRTFRSSDLMGRFGGDEFVIMMNATDNMEIAQMRCENLLKLMNGTKIFANDPKNTETIHASIGYALFHNNDDFDSLFQKSDKALYNAKNTGKDKICHTDL